MKNRYLPLFLLLALGIIWGSGYSIARYCVTHGVPPLGYSFWQSIGPAIFLLLCVIVRRHRMPFNPQYLRYYILCGVLGIAIPNTLMYYCAAHLPSGLIAVMVNTVPIWIYPLALLFAQEKWNTKRFCAVILGVIGILWIVLQGAQWSSVGSVPWMLLLLLVPLSFALCALFITAFRPVPAESMSLSAGMLIVSALCVTPWTLHLKDFYGFAWPLKFNDWLILLEIALSSAGYVILFALLKRASPVFYSLVGGVVSLTGLFWGWLVFHETLTLGNLCSIALILVALGIMTASTKKAA